MSLNMVRYMIAVVSLVCIVFLSYIVRKLRLVEVNFTVLSIPYYHVTKCVLYEKTVSTYKVAVHLNTCCNGIVRGID